MKSSKFLVGALTILVCASGVQGGMDDPQGHVWARQINPENRAINALNNGGTMWILGLKTENYGAKIEQLAGCSKETNVAVSCF